MAQSGFYFSKSRRFYFHYNKPASLAAGHPKLSVHWMNACYIVDAVDCQVPVKSKINKRQPRVVMQGMANSFLEHVKSNGLREVVLR